MSSIIARLGFACVLAGLLSACATFTGDQLPRVEKLPDKSSFAQRPVVNLQPKMYVGLLGDKVKPAENLPGTQRFKEVVEAVTKESTLFRAYSLDEFKAGEADYRIKLELQNHGNQGAAMASGFLTGFTLGIIPGAATDNYRLSVTVVDRGGRPLKTFDVDDSVTTWLGIWFIPLMAKAPDKVVPEVWGNMVRNAYQKLLDDRVLRYAASPGESNESAAPLTLAYH